MNVARTIPTGHAAAIKGHRAPAAAVAVIGAPLPRIMCPWEAVRGPGPKPGPQRSLSSW
jgi:hypothetical protein